MIEEIHNYETTGGMDSPIKWPWPDVFTPASARAISPRHYDAYCRAFYKQQEIGRSFTELFNRISYAQRQFNIGDYSGMQNAFNTLSSIQHDIAQQLAEFRQFGLKAFQIGIPPERNPS